jgi:GT2 family glycosyltransferase/glycosyltransferase involved in cell wall biosynthesis
MEKKGLAWGALRRVFHNLPVGAHGKEMLKNAVYSRFPSIFGGLMSYQLWDNRRKAMKGISNPALMFSLGEIGDLSVMEIGADGLELPTSLKPIVSVIIPVYGKINYTLQCLRSIAKNPPQAPFEIIVVDDLSADNTREVLASAAGLRVIFNETNQGFIRSCNSGAAAARGEYLLFLNNDTVICPGWLDELLRTFADFPETGLVGSKLVYPDGSLQEAGGIIWRDGSAWNFGRGQDHAHPMFNYAREVDYISGASIMIHKALFEELGRFDQLYLPAYGEDADLAMKVRARGLKVIYQPVSVVIHYEGITSGTDTRSGVKAYQIMNGVKFTERWKEALSSHPQYPGVDVSLAKDRNITGRALVIDACTPTPDQDSGSIDIVELIRIFQSFSHKVTFIPENILFFNDYTQALQRMGVECIYAPFYSSAGGFLEKSGNIFDVIVIARFQVAEQTLPFIKKYCPKAKIIFYPVDLHCLREERHAFLTNSPERMAGAVAIKSAEFDIIRRSDCVMVCSTKELEIIANEAPEAFVTMFPWIRRVTPGSTPFEQRSDLAFIGGYHHQPNVDAVNYFAKNIFPIVRENLPDVKFHIYGSNAPQEVRNLDGGGIVFHGFIPDVLECFESLRVFVAPLRYGAGIKGKVASSMSYGVPCVLTSIAAEGMEIKNGETALIAEDDASFAKLITNLYNDKDMWLKLSENALAHIQSRYSFEAGQKIMADALQVLSVSYSLPSRDGAAPFIISPTGRSGANRQAKNQPIRLTPVAVCRDREEYLKYRRSEASRIAVEAKNALIASHGEQMAYSIPGYCIPCGKQTLFLVDMLSCGIKTERGWVPNFRERLECPGCRLNNRQRLVASLMKQQITVLGDAGVMVYMMEQVTPIYKWAICAFPTHEIIGSEYFEGYPSGQVVKGVRNENVEAMSFGDASLDIVVSNDVLEHVPNPALALSECARALRPGGQLLMTIPFYADAGKSVTRARLDAKGVHHFLPPVYHGNPVSLDGSLVFTDFGWDILPMMREAGFADAWAEVHHAPEFGHLGDNLLVFRGSIS